MSIFLSLLLGRLKSGVGAAFSWVVASSAHILAAALVVALGWGAWQHHDYTKTEKILASTKAGYVAAQKDAAAKQLAANLAVEAGYRKKAEGSDHEHQIALDDAQRAADAYIASHRMQPAPARGAGQALASTQSGSAAVPPVASTDTIVVTGADIHTCTADYEYALAAHDWATELSKP
jgi:hypothetical protein